MSAESNLCPLLNASAYSQLVIRRDDDSGSVWYSMSPQGRPCFSLALLTDLKRFQEKFASWYPLASPCTDYLVLASEVPGVFNLGGDLDLFRSLITAGDRDGLYRYATACVDVMVAHMNGLGCDVVTISLIQGKALGGGFEAALASDILIAEEDAAFGFPEILFNMFPGMGAYSVLSRKLGGAMAEKMILSGRMYTARELHDMGLVTVLAENGTGKKAVSGYIERQKNRKNGLRALMKARRASNPVTLGEMNEVIRIWVDAALSTSARDLRVVERLVSRQRRQAMTGG